MYENVTYKKTLSVLTVDHPSRVSIPVCSMCNASTAELIRLLNCHVFPIAAVHHTVGVTISTAGRKHTTRQTRPIIIHVVQTRTLQDTQCFFSNIWFRIKWQKLQIWPEKMQEWFLWHLDICPRFIKKHN